MHVYEGSFTNNKMLGNAFMTKALLDSDPKQFKFDLASEHYQKFLEQKAKSPTAGKVVEHYILKHEPIYNKTSYSIFKSFLEVSPEIDMLIKTIKEKESQQSRTLSLRNKLIENDRIDFDRVTPKLKGLKKLLLKLRVMF